MRIMTLPLIAAALVATSCDGLRGAAKVALPAAQAALEPVDLSLDTSGAGIIQMDSMTIAVQGELDARLSLRVYGAPVWTVCRGSSCEDGDARATHDLYYRVATGGAADERWAQLHAITCDEARTTLPALSCPAKGLDPPGTNPSSGRILLGGPPPPPPDQK